MQRFHLGNGWSEGGNINNSHFTHNGATIPNTILLTSDTELSISPVEPLCKVFGGRTFLLSNGTAACPLNNLTNPTVDHFGKTVASFYSAFASAWSKMETFSYTGPFALAQPLVSTASATASATHRATSQPSRRCSARTTSLS